MFSLPARPQEERKGKVDTELATVLSSISVACKQIAAAVGLAGISSLTGVAGTGENVQVRRTGGLPRLRATRVLAPTACAPSHLCLPASHPHPHPTPPPAAG